MGGGGVTVTVRGGGGGGGGVTGHCLVRWRKFLLSKFSNVRQPVVEPGLHLVAMGGYYVATVSPSHNSTRQNVGLLKRYFTTIASSSFANFVNWWSIKIVWWAKNETSTFVINNSRCSNYLISPRTGTASVSLPVQINLKKLYPFQILLIYTHENT